MQYSSSHWVATLPQEAFMWRASHLPVVFPRGDHLSAQHTDDPVKALLVVWQQLVLIATPDLHKHSSLIQSFPGALNTIATHGLTLFMSSDMTSLGWAVLASIVTSTVKKNQKKQN